MPWTPPPEERLRLLVRAQRLSALALAALVVAVVAAVVVIITQPDRWWEFAIGLVLVSSMGVRTLGRRRRIAIAKARVEAEMGRARHTSTASPDGS